MKSLLLLLSLSLSMASFSEAGPSFLVIEKTTSPDERYALAWGIRGVTNLKKQLKGGSDFIEGNEENLENYLVDLSLGKIITKLVPTEDEPRFWSIPANVDSSLHAPLNLTLEAAWTPASNLVVISYGGKWGNLSLQAIQLEEGEVVANANFTESFGKNVHAYLSRKFPAQFKRSKDSLTLWMTDLAWTDGEVFSLRVSAGPTKTAPENADLNEELEVNFDFVTKGGKPRLNVSKIIKAQPLADPAVLADRHLNEAYSALRAQLGAKDKTSLKSEQIAWLAERDRITKSAEMAEFVESRAAELEERLRALKRR